MSTTRRGATAAKPPTEQQAQPEWEHLEARPQSWSKQLYVKGRRLPASVVWSSMLANNYTREQAARNWDLSLEELDECIRYSETHEDLIGDEADDEKRELIEAGYWIEPPATD